MWSKVHAWKLVCNPNNLITNSYRNKQILTHTHTHTHTLTHTYTHTHTHTRCFMMNASSRIYCLSVWGYRWQVSYMAMMMMMILVVLVMVFVSCRQHISPSTGNQDIDNSTPLAGVWPKSRLPGLMLVAMPSVWNWPETENINWLASLIKLAVSGLSGQTLQAFWEMPLMDCEG